MKFILFSLSIFSFVKFLNYLGIGVGVKFVMFKKIFFKVSRLLRFEGSDLEKLVKVRFKILRDINLFNDVGKGLLKLE